MEHFPWERVSAGKKGHNIITITILTNYYYIIFFAYSLVS